MKRENKVKFFMQMDGKMLKTVEEEARRRGIDKQQMLRAVVIPEWLGRQ